MSVVKIRYRQVIARVPQYGRYGEYQVVLGRKILSRHDMMHQAERWIEENDHTRWPAVQTTPGKTK
jgi:hypothetical protein